MDTLCYERRKVYDLPLRLIHVWNALVILLLQATGWLSDFFEADAPAAGIWNVLILAGYGLVAGLAARLSWGLVGPRHARFTDLWHPRAWLAALPAFATTPETLMQHSTQQARQENPPSAPSRRNAPGSATRPSTARPAARPRAAPPATPPICAARAAGPAPTRPSSPWRRPSTAST